MVDSNSNITPNAAPQPARPEPQAPLAPQPTPAPVIFSTPVVPGQTPVAPAATPAPAPMFTPPAANPQPAKELSPLEAALAMLNQSQSASQTQNPPVLQTNPAPAPIVTPPTPAIPETPVPSAQESDIPEPPKLKMPSAGKKPRAKRAKRKNVVQNDNVARPVVRKNYFSKRYLKRYGIIGGISLVVIVAAVIIANILADAPAIAHKATPFETDAIIMRERPTSGYYALATKDGKLATRFNLEQVWPFYDGYALVKNSAGQFGIANDSGGMSVRFGRYSKIAARGPVYLAQKSERDIRILIGTGKTIAKTDNIDTNEIIARDGIPFFIYRTGSNKYDLYDARGDRLKSFESSTEPQIAEQSTKTRALVLYAENAILLNGENYEIIAETDYKPEYSVSEMSYDASIVRLENENRNALIVNGTFRDDYDSCKNVELQNDAKAQLALALCERDDGRMLISSTGDIADTRVSSGVAYFTPDTYATFADGQANFYLKGELKRSFESASYLYRSNAGYSMRFLDKDGITRYSIVSKTGDIIYSSLNAFTVKRMTSTNRAIIKLPGRTGYRLVSSAGETDESYYDVSMASEKLFVAQNFDKSFDVLDENGKKITERSYSDYAIGEDGSLMAYYGDKVDYFNPDGQNTINGAHGGNSYPTNGYASIDTGNGSFEYYLPDGTQIK